MLSPWPRQSEHNEQTAVDRGAALLFQGSVRCWLKVLQHVGNAIEVLVWEVSVCLHGSKEFLCERHLLKKKKLQFSPLKEQIIVIYLSDKCCFYGQKKEGGETWGLCNSISVVYLQKSIISHHDFVSLITCVYRFVDQRYLRVTLDTSQSELSLFHDSFTTDNTDRCFWM